MPKQREVAHELAFFFANFSLPEPLGGVCVGGGASGLVITASLLLPRYYCLYYCQNLLEVVHVRAER